MSFHYYYHLQTVEIHPDIQKHCLSWQIPSLQSLSFFLIFSYQLKMVSYYHYIKTMIARNHSLLKQRVPLLFRNYSSNTFVPSEYKYVISGFIFLYPSFTFPAISALGTIPGLMTYFLHSPRKSILHPSFTPRT